MPINTVPKDGPTINSPVGASARDRAIAKLTQAPAAAAPQAQETPVQNPTNVSPEELSAIKPSTASQTTDNISQKDNNETSKVDEATKAKESLSSQYALMARKEKAIRAKQLEIQTKEAEFKAREEALKAKDAEYQSKYIPKERLTQDTLNVLNELGISYEQLTSLILKTPGQSDSPEALAIKELQAEVKRLNDSQDATKKSYEENQQNAYKQAVNQIRSEAVQLVKTDPQFETIQATNSVDDVVSLIEKTFKEDGILLTVEEACREVEEYMVEETLKLARLKKIQAKLQPKPTVEQTEQKIQETKTQSQSAKTLTNAVGTTRQLTAKERAILAFKGELNK